MKKHESYERRKIWDALSSYWDERMSDEGDWYNKFVIHPVVLKIIGKIKGKKILDAGSGTGSLARVLARKGAKITAVDYSKEMLNFAIRRQERENLNIRYHCFYLENLPKYINQKFDVVVVNLSFQDFVNYQDILKAFRKLLHKGKKLILSLEHPCFTIFDNLHVTSKRKWLNFLYSEDDPLKVLTKYKNYHRSIIFWTRNLSMVSFHRTLEEYSIALYKNKFTISRIFEPTIPIEEIPNAPQNSLIHKIPLFMIIEAISI